MHNFSYKTRDNAFGTLLANILTSIKRDSDSIFNDGSYRNSNDSRTAVTRSADYAEYLIFPAWKFQIDKVAYGLR